MSPTRNGSFTFARGNAAKLAALPRYAAGRMRTRLRRRDPRVWAFGSAFGLADGALAVLRAARRLDPSLRLVWLTDGPAQANRASRLGIEWAEKDSRAGFDATAGAGVLVVTHGFGDVNRYAIGGATIAQLWHGSPFKKLHADSPRRCRWGRSTGWPWPAGRCDRRTGAAPGRSACCRSPRTPSCRSCAARSR